MRHEGIVDPVTGFVYPAEWTARCTSPDDHALAASGLGVLTASGTVLRRGFTTGTTAAAACTAAVLSLRAPVSEVVVVLPCGFSVFVPADGRDGAGAAIKYAGDYPADATAGLRFAAVAEPAPEGIVFEAGEGIGRFVRDTPRFCAGAAAISETAMRSILGGIKTATAAIGISGVRVCLSIPEGRAIAGKTLNPRIGIEGGISVLGSTGLVEPWDDHLSESAFERIRDAERVVLTTGRLGLRYSRLLFPDYEVVLVGINLGRALDAVGGEAVICALPGLVMKFIDPEILEGTGCGTVEELTVTPAWPGIMERVFARFRAVRPGVRIVIVDRGGRVMGDSG